MKEIEQSRIDGAKRASVDWERLWRIFTFADKATAEELAWAKEFFEHNFQNMRDIAMMTSDLKERELLELVYLGLFHRGYTLPLGLKYLKGFEN